MIDELCFAVYNFIKDQCGEGYAVISNNEIIDGLGGSFSFEEIDKAMRTLDREAYVALRFAEGGEYCFCVLEKKQNDTVTVGKFSKSHNTFVTTNYKQFIVYLIADFFSAFLGALLALLLVR